MTERYKTSLVSTQHTLNSTRQRCILIGHELCVDQAPSTTPTYKEHGGYLGMFQIVARVFKHEVYNESRESHFGPLSK